jgi:replicative DNA helicase
MNLEQIILYNILKDNQYARVVIPHLKKDYFQQSEHKVLFNTIVEYVEKYNNTPTYEALIINLNDNKAVDEQTFTNVGQLFDSFTTNAERWDRNWLIDKTEEFCKQRSIYNAIVEGIEIVNDTSNQNKIHLLPQILTDALNVSFDTKVGHEYLDQANERYLAYTSHEQRIPFNLDSFNQITGGGLKKKTLNIIMAGCVHPDTKIRVRIFKK